MAEGISVRRTSGNEIAGSWVAVDDASGVDMCQPATLRMMEQENLKAFKEATQATKPAIMERVIKDYCHSGVD
ncbi:MAG: hypothetical protein VX837_03600, partial [Candidatus Thermoplasmatota archaeon]|nr:hypothetical protein [Candidatus Thermoplasmatota archaeon]